jgi:hypothetical protein
VVYCSVLYGRCGEYLSAEWCGGVACVECDGKIGIDGDAVFDWDWAFTGHGASGGCASDVAGGGAVDFGGGYFVVADTCGVDWVLGWRDWAERKIEATAKDYRRYAEGADKGERFSTEYTEESRRTLRKNERSFGRHETKAPASRCRCSSHRQLRIVRKT